jgi:hypothetical protein
VKFVVGEEGFGETVLGDPMMVECELAPRSGQLVKVGW